MKKETFVRDLISALMNPKKDAWKLRNCYPLERGHSGKTEEMIVLPLILIVAISFTHGFPWSLESEISDTELQQSRQRRDISAGGQEQETVFQIPEQQGAIFLAPEQGEIFLSGEQEGIFEGGEQQAIVEGSEKQAIFEGGEQQQAIAIGGLERASEATKQKIDRQQSGEDRFSFGSGELTADFGSTRLSHVQVGCAAALLCVEEKFCGLDGTIGAEAVAFTEKQLVRRVPLTSCRNPETGVIGKCCRDPNYVDPWPTGNLPANYTGGFDEKGFPTFLHIVKIKPANIKSPSPVAVKSPPRYPTKDEPNLIPENSDIFTETLIPPALDEPLQNHLNTIGQKLRCGVRNQLEQQLQVEGSKTVFAEIPWQAMVLHSRDRKILCSGVLIGAQHVLTAASCVHSLPASDVSVKLGEWKLGYELKYEEPLPFQIVNVSSIGLHPGYSRPAVNRDLALLRLQAPTTFDLHIKPVCLPATNRLAESTPCVASGWGNSILRAHYVGAIMHAVPIDLLSADSCRERLENANLRAEDANQVLCGAPTQRQDNACEMDAGAPLACRNEHGLYELAGIYSQDAECLSTNQVAVFARLDQAWLKETLLESTPDQSKTDVRYEDYRKSTLSADNRYLPPI